MRPRQRYGDDTLAHPLTQSAVIPMRQCFVLGDNRGTSYNSSSWGCLAENDVLGKVWLSW